MFITVPSTITQAILLLEYLGKAQWESKKLNPNQMVDHGAWHSNTGSCNKWTLKFGEWQWCHMDAQCLHFWVSLHHGLTLHFWQLSRLLLPGNTLPATNNGGGYLSRWEISNRGEAGKWLVLYVIPIPLIIGCLSGLQPQCFVHRTYLQARSLLSSSSSAIALNHI